jgi:hypothetical protein
MILDSSGKFLNESSDVRTLNGNYLAKLEEAEKSAFHNVRAAEY